MLHFVIQQFLLCSAAFSFVIDPSLVAPQSKDINTAPDVDTHSSSVTFKVLVYDQIDAVTSFQLVLSRQDQLQSQEYDDSSFSESTEYVITVGLPDDTDYLDDYEISLTPDGVVADATTDGKLQLIAQIIENAEAQTMNVLSPEEAIDAMFTQGDDYGVLKLSLHLNVSPVDDDQESSASADGKTRSVSFSATVIEANGESEMTTDFNFQVFDTLVDTGILRYHTFDLVDPQVHSEITAIESDIDDGAILTGDADQLPAVTCGQALKRRIADKWEYFASTIEQWWDHLSQQAKIAYILVNVMFIAMSSYFIGCMLIATGKSNKYSEIPQDAPRDGNVKTRHLNGSLKSVQVA
ncbi:hypothetical protein MP228_001856 [Amoeboaphelidium protococcarum]|nr:hypothetical protein MP228_001856 [Amoeboaphelidium protococcarum]